MSDQTSVDAEKEQVVNSPDGEQVGTASKEAKTDVEALQAELAKNQELIKKLRKYEKENLARAEQEAKAKEDALKEQGRYKELYEELNGKLRKQTIEQALESALTDAKAKSTKTVKALINISDIEFDGDQINTKALKAKIEEVKKEHSILFEAEAAAPSVKRAGENDPIGGYEKELRAAKTAKELNAVLRKYGKI